MRQNGSLYGSGEIGVAFVRRNNHKKEDPKEKKGEATRTTKKEQDHAKCV